MCLWQEIPLFRIFELTGQKRGADLRGSPECINQNRQVFEDRLQGSSYVVEFYLFGKTKQRGKERKWTRIRILCTPTLPHPGNIHRLFLIYPATPSQLTIYGSWYSLRVCFTRVFWGQKIALSTATKDAGYAGSTGPQTPVIKLVASGRSCMTPWLWDF